MSDDKSISNNDELNNTSNEGFNSGIINKTEYFDLFISYKRDNGGDHGQKLAEELYDKLTKDGYKVWLDNEEIGFSSNFEQRIEEAIVHSKKIACILGPEWVKSDNCRYEIKKAIGFEKRIIPIHYQEFRQLLTAQKDAGALTIDEWNRIDKPQEVDFSAPSKYAKAYQDLKAVCDLKDDITSQHTRILCESYYWNKYKQPKSMLYTGTMLSQAKLLRSKSSGDGEASSFTELQNSFLDASETYVTSEASKTRKAFIAYRAPDFKYAAELNIELKLHNVSTFFNEDINFASDPSAFQNQIINSDNVVNILNEDYPDDDESIKFALSKSKRVLDVSNSKEVVSKFKAEGGKNIFLWNEQVRIDGLISTINGDKAYNLMHTKTLSAAFEWENSGKSTSNLLGYSDAKAGQEWYKLAEELGTEPQPNLNMINFIERSLTYADAQKKRRRLAWWSATIGVIFLLVFIGLSIYLNDRKTLAEEKESDAITAQGKAENAAADATEKSKKAEQKEKDANRNARKARLEEFLANFNKAIAEKQRNKAILAEASARKKQQEASKKAKEATAKELQANINLIKADHALIRADLAKSKAQKEADSILNITMGTEYAKIAYDVLHLSRDANKEEIARKKADTSIHLLNKSNQKGQLQPLFSVYTQLLPATSLFSPDYEGSANTIALLSSEFKSDNDTLNRYPIYENRHPVDSDSIVIGSPQNIDAKKLDDFLSKVGSKDISALCIAPSQKSIAIGYKSGRVEIWDYNNQKKLDSVAKHSYRITSLSFGPNGKQLAAACIQNKISITRLTSEGIRERESETVILEEVKRVSRMFFWNENILITEDLLNNIKAWSTSVSTLKEL